MRVCAQGGGATEVVHAALLVLMQLLRHPGDFMRREVGGYPRERYNHHVARVLSLRLHKDDRVRHTVLELIPMLAAFNITWFVTGKFERDSEKWAPAEQAKSFLDVSVHAPHLRRSMATPDWTRITPFPAHIPPLSHPPVPRFPSRTSSGASTEPTAGWTA